MQNLYGRLQVLESQEMPLGRTERLSAMVDPLLFWFQENARVLPWRERPEAYRVWISEIMLQQTRVEAVKPYFARFIEELPDVRALAEVEEERLLKLWEGLGYYNRARNLKKAAALIMETYGGQLPASYEELLKLPGIGCYTAGAIASIAYGIPVPAVDGNVLRVISRVLANEEDISKQSVRRRMEEDIKKIMPRDRSSLFNQALMEIGAVVCLPNGQPLCGRCPCFAVCLARKRGLLASIPFKAPKKQRKIEEKTVLLIEAGDRVAIRKRSGKGLLASLYEFPNFEGKLTKEEAVDALMAEAVEAETIRVEDVGEAKHIFSHVEWHMTGYRVRLRQIPKSYIAAGKQEIKEKYPIPGAFLAYTKLINGKD